MAVRVTVYQGSYPAFHLLLFNLLAVYLQRVPRQDASFPALEGTGVAGYEIFNTNVFMRNVQMYIYEHNLLSVFGSLIIHVGFVDTHSNNHDVSTILHKALRCFPIQA